MVVYTLPINRSCDEKPKSIKSLNSKTGFTTTAYSTGL